jgi:hypothetical protein
MNEISLFGSDLLLIVCAVVVSFALGSLHRLGRSLARQRRAVTLIEQDVRELTQQCDRQQASVTRLHQELSEMRQALMQQALAMAPVHAAARAPAAASSVAAVPAPPVLAPAVAPAAQRPPVTKPAPSTMCSDPLALARAGTTVQVLMQRCALSRAEAELVISVHGGKRRAAA